MEVTHCDARPGKYRTTLIIHPLSQQGVIIPTTMVGKLWIRFDSFKCWFSFFGTSACNPKRTVAHTSACVLHSNSICAPHRSGRLIDHLRGGRDHNKARGPWSRDTLRGWRRDFLVRRSMSSIAGPCFKTGKYFSHHWIYEHIILR